MDLQTIRKALCNLSPASALYLLIGDKNNNKTKRRLIFYVKQKSYSVQTQRAIQLR